MGQTTRPRRFPGGSELVYSDGERSKVRGLVRKLRSFFTGAGAKAVSGFMKSCDVVMFVRPVVGSFPVHYSLWEGKFSFFNEKTLHKVFLGFKFHVRKKLRCAFP